LEFFAPKAISFDNDGAPPQTIVLLGSDAVARLDMCCSYEWMELDTHFLTHNLNCNDVKPIDDALLASASAVVNFDKVKKPRFGCCYPPNWKSDISELVQNTFNVGAYDQLESTSTTVLSTFCDQARWEGVTKLKDTQDASGAYIQCNSSADCPPTLKPWFNSKFVPTSNECTHQLNDTEVCPEGFREENLGRRMQMDCEPWMHEERDYNTQFSVGERQCAACAIQNCERCNSHFRECDLCAAEYSLNVDGDTRMHRCVLSAECPDDRYSTTTASSDGHHASVEGASMCIDWTVCGTVLEFC
jgi:hypothetical protein